MYIDIIQIVLAGIIIPLVGVIVLWLKHRNELYHQARTAEIGLTADHARLKLELQESHQELEIEKARAESETENRRDKVILDIVETFKKEIEEGRRDYQIQGRQLRDTTINFAGTSQALIETQEALETAVSRADEYKEQSSEVLISVEKLVDANKVLTGELKTLSQQHQAAMAENANLQAIKGKLEGFEKSFDTLNTLLAKQDTEIERLREERNAAQKQLRDSQQTYTAVLQEMVALRIKLASCEKQMLELKQRFEQMQEDEEEINKLPSLEG